MDEEVFKKIEGFPNYEVSNMGNIRRDGKIIMPDIQTAGYKQISLRKDGQTYPRLVHRLVLQTFEGLPENKERTQVNHKDENKQNNELSNLEWCTPAENCSYGTKPLKQRNARKQVILAYPDGDISKVIRFDTIEEAVQTLCISYRTIRDVLNKNADNSNKEMASTCDMMGHKWVFDSSAATYDGEGNEVWVAAWKRRMMAKNKQTTQQTITDGEKLPVTLPGRTK